MDKIYLNEIYIYYKELFTEKQQMYFEDYYFERTIKQNIMFFP